MTTVFPQGYPLWLAARHDRESPVRVGRVIGWADLTPVVAWRSEEADIRAVSPPDRGEMWWLGDTAAEALYEERQAYSRACPDHGAMVRAEEGRWRCTDAGCGYEFGVAS